ncbi:hypothetical protein PF006_g28596 [Phytophthora fragariae]|uniref:Uncharacterized protein n=1 Tax=Phytophthora fragariae TaxID=53985 RepID=A0A6A3QDW7_9STRA|nr:hypothetical protein PF003_g1127 [Phytophthora fragariae]KAE9014958.1 hypothetical protein PF011_g7824 [Phytophthora fragariae]KAE9074133.1 hypothetical protein PF006_g28596 [Phytophthora fragariae]KAE9164354.1 hypothetical protein PF004_g29849 [Phytophthora fragariae]
MSTEDIFSTLTNLATNPAVLTNTAGLVASLATGNTPGIATNAAGLTAAVTPVLVSAFTPAPASEAALAAALSQLPFSPFTATKIGVQADDMRFLNHLNQ